MNLELSDCLIIVIVLVVISFVIGFAMLYTLDKKISDITIKIPKQDVYIQVDENSKGKFNICSKNQDTSYLPSKGNVIEGFRVSDMQPLETLEDKKTNEEIDLSIANTEIPAPTRPSDPRFIDSQLDARTYQEKLDALPPAVKSMSFIPRGIVNCNNRIKPKYQIIPDQIRCDKSNHRTGENYYNFYYNYPFVPTIEKMKYAPSNEEHSIANTSMPVNVTYKIVQGPLSADPSRPQIANSQYSEYVFENSPDLQNDKYKPLPGNYVPFLSDAAS